MALIIKPSSEKLHSFSVGDKVRYDNKGYADTHGVYNGHIGTVTAIANGSMYIQVTGLARAIPYGFFTLLEKAETAEEFILFTKT